MVVLFNQYYQDNVIPTLPINLLSLASYLNSKNVETRIFEAKNNHNVTHIVREYKPDLVGIGCQFTTHYNEVLSIAETIKKVTGIPVVIGGNHASSLNNLDRNIDYIIKGEGENALLDLCLGKVNSRIIPPYPLIQNLDELPCLDYNLVDLKEYSYSSPYFMREPVMGIITSRGCPNNCIYCTVKGVWGRTWRGKSPERVVSEIEKLMGLGIKEFAILDDSVSVDKERWNKILDLIIKLKLDIKWFTPNGIAHWTLDKPILKKMKRAGCYRITFGIESGNNRIRKFLGKPYPLPYDLIDYANKIGMWTISTNILGFPDETEQEMYDTLNFAKKSGVDFATFFILDSYPTADIYKYKTDLTLAKRLQFIFYKKFLIHRILTGWNIIFKIHSPEDLRYTLGLVINGVKIFIKSFKQKTTKGLLYNV